MSAATLIILLSAMSLVVGVPGDDNETTNLNTSNKVSTVKVLIYDGDGSMEESIAGLKACLDECNSRNLTGYYFEYETSSEINSNTLSGYDILIMPGGNSDRYVNGKKLIVRQLNNSSTKVKAI